MNAIIAALTLSAGLTLGAPPGSVESEVPSAVAPTAVSSCCEAELAEAHELRFSGQLRAAHRRFHAVARRQAAAGEFSGDALWHAAETSYALGNLSRTAREMEEVARMARNFGRPNLEVRALLEATQLRHLGRRDDLVAGHFDRIQRLLDSPDVSEETRTLVTTRLTIGRVSL